MVGLLMEKVSPRTVRSTTSTKRSDTTFVRFARTPRNWKNTTVMPVTVVSLLTLGRLKQGDD